MLAFSVLYIFSIQPTCGNYITDLGALKQRYSPSPAFGPRICFSLIVGRIFATFVTRRRYTQVQILKNVAINSRLSVQAYLDFAPRIAAPDRHCLLFLRLVNLHLSNRFSDITREVHSVSRLIKTAREIRKCRVYMAW